VPCDPGIMFDSSPGSADARRSLALTSTHTHTQTANKGNKNNKHPALLFVGAAPELRRVQGAGLLTRLASAALDWSVGRWPPPARPQSGLLTNRPPLVVRVHAARVLCVCVRVCVPSCAPD
jgi:hypothetical protein